MRFGDEPERRRGTTLAATCHDGDTERETGRPTTEVRRQVVLCRQKPDRRDQAGRQRMLHAMTRWRAERPTGSVTAAEAARQFGLRLDICERVLTALARQDRARHDVPGREGQTEDEVARPAPSRTAGTACIREWRRRCVDS